VFDDLDVDPFGTPRGKGKIDTQFVQVMMGAVQTGISLIRLKKELGIDVSEDEVNDLVYMQKGVFARIQSDQGRRRKKAKDMAERDQALKDLDDLPLVDEDEDDVKGGLPF